MLGRAVDAARQNLPLVVAALATLVCTAGWAGHRAGWFTIPGLDAAERDLIDARFRARGPRPVRGDDIVIVGLDDETRRRDPALFQRRSGWARLVAALGEYRPRAIGVDAFFSAREVVLSADALAAAKDARAALGAEAAAAPPSPAATQAGRALDTIIDETRGDEKLAAAIRAAGVVYLAVLFDLEGEPAAAGTPEPRGLAGARFDEAFSADVPRTRRPPRAAEWATVSLAALGAASAGAGFVNVVVDDDGAVRRAHAVIEHAGRFYAPLGLRVAAAGAETPEDSVLSYVAGDRFVMWGARKLPVDARGRAWLDFLGPRGRFPSYSAVDVVEKKVPAEALAGKLVFVGFTDTARDRVTTPYDPERPGVELHALLAHNARHGELLVRRGPGTTLASIVALGGLVTLLQLRRVRQRRAWLVVVLAGAALAGFVAWAFWLFSARREIVDVAAPAAAHLIVALAALGTALVVEGLEKARVKQAFSQYLDDRAVAQLLADPGKLRLGGERRVLTVLFSDIRGFSQVSERLEPEQLSAFLNEYLTPMTDLVLEAGGLLDKYIGDAVMAVFGAPLEQGDHAARACRVALAMQARLVELNRSFAARGLPELAIGVGVSTGAMSVGNMGSARRFDYTVVGDSVNLGARLEALTKEYGAAILVSEEVVARAGDGFVFRELDLVRVKGKGRTVRVYELLGTAGAAVQVPEGFAAALEAYRARRFGEAAAGFAAVAAAHPEDAPAAAMAERARQLAARPPGDDWDGAYEQLGK